MIYFVLIDQDTGYYSKTIHDDLIQASCNQQIKFFKELRQYGNFDFTFVWAYNHPLAGNAKSFYKSLIEVELNGIGSFVELTSSTDIASKLNDPSEIYLLGGNVQGCMINKTLPYNYYSLSINGVTPKIVLDLCYDYSLPYNSDRELYSTLAHICNVKKLDFIDSFSLKKKLLIKKFTS